MKDMNCCLTLVGHRSLEERLVDHLLEYPEWVPGFSVLNLEGGSQNEFLSSRIEQVRGRSRRVQIQTVMNLDDARELIIQLKREEHGSEIAYWITPVVEFGRLV